MALTNKVEKHSERAPWHAIYTRHQHEKTVAESLANHGIEIFLPTYGVVRKWKDRTKQLSLPLFPCYVFIHGSLKFRARILSTPGVYSFVGVAGQAAEIHEHEMEMIRKAVNSDLRVEPFPFLRCGDRVRVKAGALAGIEGILIRKKSSYRLILSAELLQKSIAVEVDAFSVEPVSPRTGVGAAPLGHSPADHYRIGERTGFSATSIG
jgi:transcription antitermination factor NusG